MSDDDLLRLGFVRLDNGTFLPPPGSAIVLVPMGRMSAQRRVEARIRELFGPNAR